MSILNSILATVRFELSRVLTFQRSMVALVMALFPPTMIFILKSTGALGPPEFILSLFCGMICLLSLLLWSTSNVYAELEGKSWTFVTTRPFGRWSILFGKYLIGFGLSFLISWIALTLCMLVTLDTQFLTEGGWQNETITITDPSRQAPLEETVGEQQPEIWTDAGVNTEPAIAEGNSRFMIWLYLSALLFLASMVYSAIFSFLGVIVQRRAMVFAVGYFGIVEIVCAGIPAIIGKVAMSFHMFCLLFQWMGWIIPDPNAQRDFQNFYQVQPPWIHLSAIFGMTLIMLGLSAFVIRIREYITLEDAQV